MIKYSANNACEWNIVFYSPFSVFDYENYEKSKVWNKVASNTVKVENMHETNE